MKNLPATVPMACLFGALGLLLAETPARGGETVAESEVRQAMAEVVSAAQALDAEAILARLDPDPACRYFVQGQPFNHADLGVFLKNAFSNMSLQKIHWRECSVQELSPDFVRWTSHGRNPVVDAAGAPLGRVSLASIASRAARPR